MNRSRAHLPTLMSVCLLAYSGVAAALPGDGRAADPQGLTVYAVEQYSYDNNLYRLPAQFGADVVGPNVSRQDHINSLSVGASDELRFGAQYIDVAVQVFNNRFVRNSELNNNSGMGTLTWNWRFSPLLTGELGGEFHRALAGFANTRFFGRDLVDTGAYFAAAHFRLSTHWRINGTLRNSDTTHSPDAHRSDNFRSKSVKAGIEYLLSETDSLGFDYGYTDATFPYLITVAGAPFNRSYSDRTGKVFLKYAPTGKTTLDLNAGYLRRRYPDGQFGAFSGNTWRGSLQWQVSGKTQIVMTAWRDLTAYLDSESDYFVARGESLSPTWNPTNRIAVSMDFSWNDLRYIGTSPSVLEFESRHDKLRYQQATVKYVARDWLTFQMSYRLEARDSNQTFFAYSDRLAQVAFTASL